MTLATALLLASPAFAEPASMRIADHIVAVAIAAKASAVAFKPFGAFSAVDQTTGELTKLISGKEYKVEADHAKLVFGPHLFGGSTRLIPGKTGEFVTIGDKKYTGNLTFRPNKDGTITVVDELGLEEYLFGVLPHEMSPDWPLEALKAQAVASRSFALASLGRHEEDGFDLSDDTLSQVYTGLTTESDRIKEAVRSTAGQTLTYAGKPLTTYFHSTCGGHTSDAEDVWGRHAPKPLKGVKDKWCKASPHYEWEAYFTNTDILLALNKNGFTAAKLLSVKEGERGTAGWLSDIRIKTDRGWKRVPANQFRLWLGVKELKSVRLDKIKKRKKGFEFIGHGYGHGVGLCQWGARAQADAGWTYKDILEHYFPESKLVKVKP